MPFVTVRMLSGRSLEQKRRLVEAITDALVRYCHADPATTMVVIEEIPPEHWARGGQLIADLRRSSTDGDSSA